MRNLPWQLILKQAPTLLKIAGDLLLKSRSWSADIATAKDLNALRDRCAELARDQQAYAELIKQLTDQVNAITVAVRRCMMVGGAGVVLGVVACAIALLR